MSIFDDSHRRLKDIISTAFLCIFLALLLYKFHYTGLGAISSETAADLHRREAEIHLELATLLLFVFLIPGVSGLLWILYRLLRA